MKYKTFITKDDHTLITEFNLPTSTSLDELEVIAKNHCNSIESTDILYCAGGMYVGEVYHKCYEVWRPLPLDTPEVALRYNSNKPELSEIFKYVPIDAMLEEAKVWKSGAEKYGMRNWEKFWGDDTINVVMNSLLRHANAIIQGETRDKESGLHHSAHIRSNAAMLIRYFDTKEKPQ